MAKPSRSSNRAQRKRAREPDSTRYPPWLCWTCGHLCDAASCLREPWLTPKEHDIAVCIACGAVTRLRNGKWLPIKAADIALLDPEERRDLVEHQVSVQLMLAVLGKPAGRRGGNA
jgi:hypothetical protein